MYDMFGWRRTTKGGPDGCRPYDRRMLRRRHHWRAPDGRRFSSASTIVIIEPVELVFEPQMVIGFIFIDIIIVVVVFRISCWKAGIDVLRDWHVLLALSLLTTGNECLLQGPIFV